MVEIKRELSLSDIPSFILSVVAIIFSIYYFFSGNDIKINKPSHIVFVRDWCLYHGTNTISIIAPISVSNETVIDNVAQISDIKIRVKLGGEKWFSFYAVRNVDFRRSPDGKDEMSGMANCKEEPDGLSYYVDENEPFLPFSLSGSQNKSFNLFFEPLVEPCKDGGKCYLENYIMKDEFSGMLKILAEKSSKIEMKFSTNPDIGHSTCEVFVNNDVVAAFERFNYLNLRCIGS